MQDGQIGWSYLIEVNDEDDQPQCHFCHRDLTQYGEHSIYLGVCPYHEDKQEEIRRNDV